MTTEQTADRTSSNSSNCGCGCDGEFMPQVTFSTFILSLASTALVQLGEVQDPESGEYHENLTLARHSIDVLHMLKCKTRECLNPDEVRLIEGVLYDLRVKYVVKTK